MKAYVLTYGIGDDVTITGIFSSYAAARRRVADDDTAYKAGDPNASYPEAPDITEYDVED